MKTSGAANLPGLRRSVEKSAERRRATELGSSPVLRQSRKRKPTSDSLEEDTPPAKKMATNEAVLKALTEISVKVSGIDQRMQNAATKDDIASIKNELKLDVKRNEDKIRGLEQQLIYQKAALEGQIGQVLEKRIASIKMERTGILTLTSEEREEKRMFLEARRSVQIWPVTGFVDVARGCRDFFERRMNIPKETVDAFEF